MNTVAQVTPIGTQAVQHRLLKINGEYSIGARTTNASMASDANCLLEAAIGTANVIAEGLSTEGGGIRECPGDIAACLWGLVYQLQMIQGIVNALEVKP
ncbi:hypothetical protein [Dyella jiangningensis]|uniref:DUF3077 domain-containing protein n=1 Tax=Dyella jiangningensis TaxID=1379159 RepID=A0A328P0Q4_9GAMM|nr:hypothetical protein [Dyella jiangningensis]RAO75797.1 hypothetical protein CA260_17315 [Dyella jiangningensis]